MQSLTILVSIGSLSQVLCGAFSTSFLIPSRRYRLEVSEGCASIRVLLDATPGGVVRLIWWGVNSVQLWGNVINRLCKESPKIISKHSRVRVFHRECFTNWPILSLTQDTFREINRNTAQMVLLWVFNFLHLFELFFMSVVWAYVSLWLCIFVCSDVCCKSQ